MSSSLFFPKQKQSSGIYIHGSVGVGKSMLMDLFHSIFTNGLSIPKDDAAADDDEHTTTDDFNSHDSNIYYNPINLKCKRYHFHEFMLQIHQQIHTYKSLHPKQDAIPYISAQIASESRLLCFDEMQITDIADAMIMKRILTLLIDLGVVIVTTSNRPPWGLYEGGINRSVFLPLVDVLMERLMIVEMKEKRIDYRKEKAKGLLLEKEKESLLLMDSNNNDDVVAPSLPSYLVTSNSNDLNDVVVKEVLNKWFSKGSGTARQETLPVAMGRTIHVTRANDSCAWFTFQELCHQPLGAADYIAIAERFDMVIVEDVPQMSGHCYNEARRFVIFVDALYEARTKLVIAANVPRDDLFLGFDATVETNDGDEEIVVDATNANSGGDIFVIGEGGSSSSSSTTMIRAKIDKTVEWSATGRIGVSLAQLSAVKEVSFSFQRAESRLAEMSLASWGR
jgi:protein AFG1